MVTWKGEKTMQLTGAGTSDLSKIASCQSYTTGQIRQAAILARDIVDTLFIWYVDTMCDNYVTR